MATPSTTTPTGTSPNYRAALLSQNSSNTTQEPYNPSPPSDSTNPFSTFGAINVLPKKRRQLMGQALNRWQITAILRCIDPAELDDTVTKILAAPAMFGADSDNLEDFFKPMTQEEADTWVTQKLRAMNFETPELEIRLKEPNMLPFQSRQRNTVQAGLVASARNWVKDALQLGRIMHGEYSHEMWIAAQFFKVKKGRLDQYGDIAVRPLVDQSILTDAAEHPLFWLDRMSTIKGMIAQIPSCTDSWIAIDIDGAYNACAVKKSSYKYQGVWIMGELFIYTTCIQGSGPAAAWFNFLLDYLYNAIFGIAHHNWWSRFVDDHQVHAKGADNATNRAKMLRAALRGGGFTVSSKTPGEVESVGNIAGVVFDHRGIRLNDEAIDVLTETLAKSPKTQTQCRALIGVALYTHSAFEWNADDLSWFAVMLEPMHAATTTKPFKWDDQCIANAIEMTQKIKPAPRWYTHFADLVTDETCLVIMTDASDTGGGAALFWVRLACATMVVPETHLHDPLVSRLLATKSKVFSKSASERPTFENEFRMAVMGLSEWGDMITTLTFEYPPGEGNPCKIGIFSDSSVTVAKLGGGAEGRPRGFVYDVPPEPIDYISARAKAFLEMRDKIAYTRYWPLTVRFCSGEHLPSRSPLENLGPAQGAIKAAQGCPLHSSTSADPHVSRREE